MNKLSTLFWAAVIALCGTQVSHAQSYWNKYLINVNFDGLTAIPSTFTVAGDTYNATAGIFGRSAGCGVNNTGSVIHDALRFNGGADGGSRGKEIKFASTEDKELINVDFDINMVTAGTAVKNALGFYLLGSKGVANGGITDAIVGVYFVGTTGKFHVWNKDIQGPEALRVEGTRPDTIIPVFDSGQYPGFRRAGTTDAETTMYNESTITDVVFTKSVWYHMSFALNFTTKKVSIIITETDNPSNTQTISDLDFLTDTPTDLHAFGIMGNRSSNQGNAGASTPFDVYVDNFQVYERVPSIGQEDVIVHYKDTENVEAKADRVAEDQEVGLDFQLTAADKSWFINNDNYYAYDAEATSTESVLVQSGVTNEITAKFKKYLATTGTYTWKGTISDKWNELDANFTTNNINQLGYQNMNNVEFSDDAAPKEIDLNGNMDLGSGNLLINAEGYSITGTGILKGTGKIEVNKSAKLGFINKMGEGLIELNGGTLEVTNIDVANKYLVDEAAILKINAGADFNRPVVGMGGTLNIEAAQNSNSYSLKVEGFEKVNVSLTQPGRLTSSTWANNWSGSTFPAGTAINVTTALDSAAFAVGSANFAEVKIHAGNGVRILPHYNQGSDPGTPPVDKFTTAKIGELSGDEGAALEGGFVNNANRHENYEIGSLNTDATFAGTIRNYGTAPLAKIFLYKKGTGIWTLTGNSLSANFGNIYVNEGTLKVDGQLGENESVPAITVDAGATLAGSGVISTLQTTIFGTITGNLTLGGPLSLQDGSTTIINVNSTSVDKITGAGDLYYGGVLKVVMQNLPTTTGTFKILDFANYELGINPLGFSSIEFPEPATDWEFNPYSGELTYTGPVGSGIAPIDYSKEIASTEYYDVTGRQVNKDYKGLVVVKVKYTDGSTGVSKIFNK